MALLNFNANNVNLTPSFEPLPAGNYEMVIVDSEMKSTRSGTGSYLQLALEVITGTFTGRKLWARLNLQNQNRKAVEIAERELASICHAVGVLEPTDSCELHNLPLIVKVDVRIDPVNGEKTNEIKGYAAKVKQATLPTNNSATPVSPTNAGSNPPWARN